MTLITTHQQLHILNSILPQILLSGKFTVGGIHMNAIVIPSKIKNGIEGTKECEKIRERNKLDYDVITEYLIDNLFAHSVNESDKDHYLYLVLTAKGEYLAACNSLSAYERLRNRDLSIEETIARATSLITNISPYGEFHLSPPPRPNPANTVITTDSLSGENPLDRLNAQLIQQRADYATMVFNEYDNLCKDEKVLQYLINEGFVRNRHDIKSDHVIYRELTDSGRKLKEIGSIAQYRIHEKNELDNKHHQRTRDKSLFWIVLFGALGTVVSAIYDGAQFLDFYKNRSLDFYRFFFFCCGFGLALLLWLLQYLLRKLSGNKK